MTLSETEIKDAATQLRTAEEKKEQIGHLSTRFPTMTMEDAYAIQDELVRLKLGEGHRQIGWKIGLTSRAMQAALKIDTPDSGILFNSMEFEDGAVIPDRRFIQPRVEAELAFVLHDELFSVDTSFVDVLRATEYVVPSLEILDTRIERLCKTTGKSRTVYDTIADNAANAGFILGGRPVRADQIDMRTVGAIVKRNGIVEETGLGAGVLNHPARGVAWLARRLATMGQSLKPGQIILSGSFIRPIETESGTTIVADFGSLGSVSCFFE